MENSFRQVLDDMGVVDGLTIASFYEQMKGLESDRRYKSYVQTIFSIIGTEIEKLHKENDQLMAQNELIIRQNEEILERLG